MPTILHPFQSDKHFAGGEREVTLRQKGQSPSTPSNLASGRGTSVVSAFAKMCPFTQETSAAEQK